MNSILLPKISRSYILLFWAFIGPMLLGGQVLYANLALYTPYTEISVPPGESIEYTIDVINNGGGIRTAAVSLTGLPEGWNYTLTDGGWTLQKISVLPREKKSLTLRVEVPFKVDKGRYTFRVSAAGFSSLPLTVNISEQGTYESAFTTNQANIEGNANSSFTYNAKLRNQTAEAQVYALRADAPRGWNVAFKANLKQVSSINVEPNATQDVTIEINPPGRIPAGTYRIPVQAVSSHNSASLELETSITGSYEIELGTPSGLLSSKVVAGDEKRIELEVRNTGSSNLENINLSYKAPTDWEVFFDPKTVDLLEPGETSSVYASIKASPRAIPGDYAVNLEASIPETTSTASFRMSVRTSLIWGWTGVLIIGVVLGGVYRLFRKYGRR